LARASEAVYLASVNRERATRHWHPRLVEAALAMNENWLDVAERVLKPHLKAEPFDVRAIPHQRMIPIT
jgi:hypothetical protein